MPRSSVHPLVSLAVAAALVACPYRCLTADSAAGGCCGGGELAVAVFEADPADHCSDGTHACDDYAAICSSPADGSTPAPATEHGRPPSSPSPCAPEGCDCICNGAVAGPSVADDTAMELPLAAVEVIAAAAVAADASTFHLRGPAPPSGRQCRALYSCWLI